MSLYTRNSLSVVSQLRNNLPNLRAYDPGPRTQFSLAQVPVQIKSVELIPGETYRWEYTVEVAFLKAADSDFVSTDEVELFKAYNGWEAANTSTNVMVLGNRPPSDLSSGFTVLHAPVGLVTMAYACFFKDADADIEGGFAYYLFSEPNPIKGQCS
jgi:hypothetical protein